MNILGEREGVRGKTNLLVCMIEQCNEHYKRNDRSMTIEGKTTTLSYLQSLFQLSRKEDIHGANFEFIVRGKERAKENTYKWVSSGIL